MGNKKRKINFRNVTLMIFSVFLIFLIFKTFLIPLALGMINILLKLYDLYKLLEMPYLFFGSALFLFMGWYLFRIFCNITYKLFEFLVTTSLYDSQKKGKNKNG